MPPRATIVIPAYNEGDDIVPGLDRLFESVELDVEVLVVVDTADDTTAPAVHAYAAREPRLRLVVNDYGRGPAQAIRHGIDAAAAETVVVTMADGCDDPRQIDELVKLVERGVVVAAASRYMPGGQQVGGPRFKNFLSRTAGRSLYQGVLLINESGRQATVEQQTHRLLNAALALGLRDPAGIDLSARPDLATAPDLTMAGLLQLHDEGRISVGDYTSQDLAEVAGLITG